MKTQMRKWMAVLLVAAILMSFAMPLASPAQAAQNGNTVSLDGTPAGDLYSPRLPESYGG